MRVTRKVILLLAPAHFLLQEMPAYAKPSKVIIHAGRPISHAATFIAEQYGTTISFEERSYGPDHLLEKKFPGGNVVVPKDVTLSFEFAQTDAVEAALNTIAHAARNVIPEAYEVRSSTSNIFGLVPDATGDPTDIPLDVELTLEANLTNTHDVLEQLAKQISAVLSGVEFYIGREGPTVDCNALLATTDKRTPAREILDGVTRLWTEHLRDPNSFYAWQLRYSPFESGGKKKVYFLVFQRLSRADTESNLFVAETARPLSSVVAFIEDQFERPVLFEEAPAECRCTLMGEPGTPRVGLSGGVVKLPWTNHDTFEDILYALINTHRIGDNNSRRELYELDVSGHIPVIKAVRTESENGLAQVKYDSLLDSVVGREIPSGEIGIEDLANIISSATDRSVLPVEYVTDGAMVVDRFEIVQPTTSQANLQTFLTENIGAMIGQVSFRLLYDPALQAHRLEARRIGRK